MAHVLRDLMAAATGATTSVAHAPFRAPLRGAAARAFANALPAALFRELRAECIARRAAERQSVMDPRSLQQTSWLAAGAGALGRGARRATSRGGARARRRRGGGRRWWQQRVPSDAPMRAHWDKDECEAADGLQLTHPVARHRPLFGRRGRPDAGAAVARRAGGRRLRARRRRRRRDRRLPEGKHAALLPGRFAARRLAWCDRRR